MSSTGKKFNYEQKGVKKEALRDCVLVINKHVQRSRLQRRTEKLSSHLIAMINTSPSKLILRNCRITFPESTNTAPKIEDGRNQVGFCAQTKKMVKLSDTSHVF